MVLKRAIRLGAAPPNGAGASAGAGHRRFAAPRTGVSARLVCVGATTCAAEQEERYARLAAQPRRTLGDAAECAEAHAAG